MTVKKLEQANSLREQISRIGHLLASAHNEQWQRLEFSSLDGVDRGLACDDKDMVEFIKNFIKVNYGKKLEDLTKEFENL